MGDVVGIGAVSQLRKAAELGNLIGKFNEKLKDLQKTAAAAADKVLELNDKAEELIRIAEAIKDLEEDSND